SWEGLHMRIRIRTTWPARILGRAVPRLLLAALAGGALLLSAAPAADALTSKHPILFVHGIEGSGAQFESQAMRFESNGYAGSWTPGRNMEGAQNVTIPDQTHVQTCTSAESFIQYFEFLRGGLPAQDIVPQKRIQLAGKALNFPQNAGLAGASVQMWPVDAN